MNVNNKMTKADMQIIVRSFIAGVKKSQCFILLPHVRKNTIRATFSSCKNLKNGTPEKFGRYGTLLNQQVWREENMV